MPQHAGSERTLLLRKRFCAYRFLLLPSVQAFSAASHRSTATPIVGGTPEQMGLSLALLQQQQFSSSRVPPPPPETCCWGRGSSWTCCCSCSAAATATRSKDSGFAHTGASPAAVFDLVLNSKIPRTVGFAATTCSEAVAIATDSSAAHRAPANSRAATFTNAAALSKGRKATESFLVDTEAAT